MRRVKPTIVHAHTLKAGVLCMLAAVAARVPISVYHVHGLALETESGLRWLAIWSAEKLACTLANRVLAVSESLRGELERLRLAKAEKVVVLGRGSIGGVDAMVRFCRTRSVVDAGRRVRERLRLPSDAVVFGYVGRLARDKGLSELADAWALLQRDFPTARLLVIGNQDERQPIDEELLARLVASPTIHLVGWRRDPRACLAAMDVLVLPSRREGFPVSILEAAAMSIPALATDVTGCRDAIVSGVTGVLVPLGDIAALRRALGEYARSGELREHHGREARHRVLLHYTPDLVQEHLVREYASLLSVEHRSRQGSARQAPPRLR